MKHIIALESKNKNYSWPTYLGDNILKLWSQLVKQLFKSNFIKNVYILKFYLF